MASEPEDPLAADRRTLTIGAVAMVGFILIGVVSAQIFTRGGCARIAAPHAAEAVDAASSTPEVVLAERLGVDAEVLLPRLEDVLGAPVAAAVAVGDATGLALTSEGLVATGPRTTALDDGSVATVVLEARGGLVGDGDALFDVGVPNATSGQVDAFVPRGAADLEAGRCVEAAVVGSPFAFLLDAGAGELLLLRLDEEGGDATVELRDASGAITWATQVALPAGPPATLAGRVTGRLGDDTVVLARRVGRDEAGAGPAVVALDRADGSVRFEVGAGPLAAAGQLRGSESLRATVIAVGPATATVTVRHDPLDAEPDAEPPASLVLLDLTDGSPVTALTGAPTLLSAVTGSGGTALASPAGEDSRVDVLGDDGELAAAVRAPGEARTLAWLGDELLVGTDRALLRRGATDVEASAALDLEVAGLTVTDDGRVAVLLRQDDQAVVVVTDPAS